MDKLVKEMYKFLESKNKYGRRVLFEKLINHFDEHAVPFIIGKVDKEPNWFNLPVDKPLVLVKGLKPLAEKNLELKNKQLVGKLVEVILNLSTYRFEKNRAVYVWLKSQSK